MVFRELAGFAGRTLKKLKRGGKDKETKRLREEESKRQREEETKDERGEGPFLCATAGRDLCPLLRSHAAAR